MKNTRNAEAEAAYKKARREVASLLGFIGEELAMHAKTARADGTSFTHVGDLGHVRKNLKETLAFLMSGDADGEVGEFIEKAIAEDTEDGEDSK